MTWPWILIAAITAALVAAGVRGLYRERRAVADFNDLDSAAPTEGWFAKLRRASRREVKSVRNLWIFDRIRQDRIGRRPRP